MWQTQQERIDYLKKKIDEITLKLQQIRVKNMPSSFSIKKGRSKHCKYVCEAIKNDPDALKCIEDCTIQVVDMSYIIEKYKNDFPIDVERLQNDSKLQDYFINIQIHPELLEQKDHDINMFIDVFSMPISIIVINDFVWEKAFHFMKKKKLFEQMMKKWNERIFYPDNHYKNVQKELSKKLKMYSVLFSN